MKLTRCDLLVFLASMKGFGLFPVPCASSFKSHDAFINQKEMFSIQPRIVGGQPAGITQFPFYAQWWGNPADTTDSIAACAATLIHSDILLTAAHCNGIADNINVIVGDYYPYSSVVQGLRRGVTDRAIHPDYDAVTVANDFLILKLDHPVPTASVVLNGNPASPFEDESLTIIGVGQTNQTGEGSPILMQVVVNYVDPATCSANYRNVSYISSKVQLCAGVPGGGKGPCYGDSGGPVLNSKGVQVGVVSASVGCAEAKYPAINARVSGAITWIQQQVCALSWEPPLHCPPNKLLSALKLENSASTKRERTLAWVHLSVLLMVALLSTQ